MKRRWDWRAVAVIVVLLGALAWVGVAIAMLLADLSPLLTPR